MSLFIEAMDDMDNKKKVGVNGSDVYSEPIGQEQELLALFGMLNRDLSRQTLYTYIDKILDKDEKMLEDLFVLSFHVRDILEGKGERQLFYDMFSYIFKKFPEKSIELMTHIPEYGAWFDLQHLTECDITDDGIKKIVQMYGSQLTKDNESPNNLSLAAKWVPRENKKYGWISKKIAEYLDMNVGDYRRFVSDLNKRLNTVEIMMCHDENHLHHFSDIDPAKVPSLCLKKKKKAFFNTNKYPHKDDEDRVRCAEKFSDYMEKAAKGKVKVHGKVLMPHEFVKEIENRSLSQDEKNTLEGQWIDLRNSIREKGTLGKTVVMADFSGSMCSAYRSSVSPIEVSKGLALLCAECTSPAFRDRIITFDSSPTWHNISSYKTIFDRVKSFYNVSQGTSTNFQAAMDLVLNRLVEANVPVGEEPSQILVITDMGWDQANNNSYSRKRSGFETHIDRIKREFASKGGWKVPTIVIWNVSGKFQEYHHESETEGVCVISGWSAAILKYIMDGDVVDKMNNMTPYRMMRNVLDDERYNPIRDTYKNI